MAFTISTAAVLVTRSGTSFSIDVTAANLSEDLNVKDFVVLDQTNQLTLSNVNFTKTSQTVITYSGADIGTNINLEVRRNTAVERFQVTQFGNKFSSTIYNEEVDRILGKIFEIVEFGVGDDTFFIPTPQNQAYGPAWATDSVRGRTANVLYNELELIPRLADNEIITGTRQFNNSVNMSGATLTINSNAGIVVNGTFNANSNTADFTGATAFVKSTPPTTDASNEVANTNFVYNVLDDIFVGMISHFNQGVTNRWLLCNGSSFSGTTYPLLASRLGGTTLPNYLGRFIVSADGGTYVLGATGGSKDAITVSHTHGVTDPGHFHSGAMFRSFAPGGFLVQTTTGSVHVQGNTDTAGTGVSINSAGASGVNANLPPYLALNIYIYAGRPQA